MTKSIINIGLAVVVAVILSIAALQLVKRDTAVAGVSDALIFRAANISSSILVATTTTTTLLATSTGRQYALIVNDSAATVYLSLKGGLPAVAYEGIRLNAGGGSYEITSENLYKGSIQAIAVGGTASTTVTEY